MGALAPDLEAEASTLKREPGLVGTGLSLILSLLEVIRRGATHFGLTALTILAVTALGYRLGWSWGYGDIGLAFGLGYLSHVLADGMTRYGVPLLWPRPGRVHLLPGPLRIRTGGPAESLVFVLAGLAVIWFGNDLIPPEVWEWLG